MLKISVIMPVYNAENYLKEAIDSILEQTFADFELIIINDGSTDNSDGIVSGYTDPRIVYLKNEGNKGLVYTLNRGLSLARGEYIARMDSDDIAMPGRFGKQVEYLDNNATVGICAMGIEQIGELGGVRYFSERSEEIAVDLLFQCALCHPTVMIRKSMLIEYQLAYDPDYEKAEDYRLWCQAITKLKIVTLREVGLKYRIHKNQVTQKFSSVQMNASNRVREQYLKDLGVTVSMGEIDDFNRACNRIVSNRMQLNNYIRFGERICTELAYDSRIDVTYFKISLYQWALILAKDNHSVSMSKRSVDILKIKILTNLIKRKIMRRRW